MMDPRDMPTAGDYAQATAQQALNTARANGSADAASRAELEKQVFVLRGQVAFLADHVIDLLKGSGKDSGMWYAESEMETLNTIKENNW